MKSHPSFAVVLAIIIAGLAQAQNTAPFELRDGDRVILLGSEFIEQDIRHNYFEAALTARWPDRRIIFRNMGWSGDTPAGDSRGYFAGADEGYKRLIAEIDRIQPTVVFVFYGSNAACEGPSGIDSFIKKLDKLVADLKRQARDVILVSPPPAVALPAPLPPVDQLNANRREITQAIAQYAKQNELRCVNLFEPMLAALGKQSEPVSYDTIRFNDRGYELAAEVMLGGLGIETPKMPANELVALRDLIEAKNDLYFHQYRPQNETYLRGFRKHEQGQNAKEIAEFDPLIAQAESRIAAFVQGKSLPEPPQAEPAAPRQVDAMTPEQELAALKPAEGFELSLFASEPMVANPIHMNFDARGRLWVASSPIYPHIRPGARPSDEILILEDTDGDGRADKRTVFADDLLIPTAVMPDDRGGAYVADSTRLLRLLDTDGDGRADQRRIILAGFGTEDTHHILHTFGWGPDGWLYFHQSIYIHTHAETPRGVVRLMGSGIWRYQPETLQTQIVSRGLINPWGRQFDRWGQCFATDGAGGEGINYAFRGSAFPTAVGYPRIVHGLNPGQPKHCGLAVIGSRGFPDDWQDSLVTSDFRGNRINRFKLEPEGSGYISKQMPDVITTSHRAFRPVDLKLGPDGALYLADWYNPIINHGEVDFRDPRRDTHHGRIWRLVAKDRPAVSRPDIEGASIPQLLDMLRSPERWTVDTARRQLALRDRPAVAAAVRQWIGKLNTADADYENARLEALWTLQTIRTPDTDLLRTVLNSSDYRARAAAVRVLADWREAMPDANVLLAAAIADKHPQVRLEAVNTARDFDNLEAVKLAAGALDHEMDQNIDFALWETLRRTQDAWLPEVKTGQFNFDGNPIKLAFAARAVENPAALAPLVTMLREGKLDEATTRSITQLIGQLGGPADLAVLFDLARNNPALRSAALAGLIDAGARRNAKPAGDLESLSSLLPEPQAAHLAGVWRLQSAHQTIANLATAADTPAPQRHGAIMGLAAYGDKSVLAAVSGSSLSADARRDAVTALTRLDPKAAAPAAAALLIDPAAESQTEPIVDAFLAHKQGPATLAAALDGKSIPTQTATLALRRASTAGDKAKSLAEVLTRSTEQAQMPQQLTPEQVSQLVKDVEARGNPQRGQSIYRQPQLACVTCHAIAGGGGKIGPDLISLGASAPVDYIIESLLQPSAKIKEGYHTVSVITTDGGALSGTLVREGGDMIVLRDAAGKEIEIPAAKIKQKIVVPVSMMPPALTASLRRDQFVDLAAFLSALGREGQFKAPSNAYVRRYEAGNIPIFASVDGTAPAEEIAGKSMRFTLEVTTPGTIALLLNDASAVRINRVGDEANLRAERILIDLPRGRHSFSIDVRPNRKTPLRIEVSEVDGSPGRAVPINE